MNKEIRELIKKNLGNLTCERIILFGSRARGDSENRSDYDILVVVKSHLTIKENLRLTSLLRKELAKKGIDADIILKSEEEISYYKERIGSVVRNALKEGELK